MAAAPFESPVERVGRASMSDTTTPQQLGEWVDSLLSQIEKRFEERNKQVVQRMNDMADRLDTLESSIQELVHGSDAKPAPTA
ncbi:hypothetical protein MEQU1_002697 [Malassezia equina]|uniref:Heat shock factor binding protein 1 n=1 Tax=Malassezia equina TaxID=1381935 RepID=A0AAF0EE64_9BASI|nr:hypothetical protein MEQU1_002697 [Malassezia equina]